MNLATMKKKIKENAKKVLGLCTSVLALQADLGSLQAKVAADTRPAYRISEPDGLMNIRRWLDLPDAVPHDNVENIWTGPIDPLTGFGLHPNTPTDFSTQPDWTNAGAHNQQMGWGYIYFDQPTWVKDANANTGERGEVWFGECCGIPRLLQRTTVNTPADDRGLLDPVLLPVGWHFLYYRLSDFSANGGTQFQFSATEDGEYANITNATHEMSSTKPEVLCVAYLACDGVPENYSIHQPRLCRPTFSPAASAGLTADEVLALIPPPVEFPDQEICVGPFVRRGNPTRWWGGWTPVFTANAATFTHYNGVSVGGVRTTPACQTDVVVDIFPGNHYLRARRARAYVWLDFELWIGGALFATLNNATYRYIDNRDDTNPDVIAPIPVNLESWAAGYLERLAVPASSSVEVRGRARMNVNGVQTSAWVRYIGGLGSNVEWKMLPRQIVTDRV